MAQEEHLELVRAVWDEFKQMRFDGALHEEVVWHTAADLPDREIARGPAEVEATLAQAWATVADPEIWVGTYRGGVGVPQPRRGRKGR